MRKLLLFLCTAGLFALVTARALLPEPVQAQAAMAQSHGYNILNLDLSLVPETAGSALIAEMNGYYLFRTPTAKNAYTGALQGKNLILICADNWQPDLSDRTACPTLYRLRQEGARVTDIYRPDWYQEMDGREFALLTGVIPTNVNGKTSLVHSGEQDIFLPYTMARVLASRDYDTIISYPDKAHEDFYRTLGFSRFLPAAETDRLSLEAVLPHLSADSPFFLCCIWTDADGSAALSTLWEHLRSQDMAEDTVLCLLTGNTEDHRAQLFLWCGSILTGAAADLPCSELDIGPTLLNLFGVEYDSRFLSGRDLFAPAPKTGQASAGTPLVTLYGSAYSDWVTDAGSYIADHSLFWQQGQIFETPREISAYVNEVNDLVYNRYVFARRVMENNYFQLVLGP